LVKKIAASRLTAKGYGESQLVNDCGCEPTNKSNCTGGTTPNRRSEFIIVSMHKSSLNNKKSKRLSITLGCLIVGRFGRVIRF
jgi:hypothetical protein